MISAASGCDMSVDGRSIDKFSCHFPMRKIGGEKIKQIAAAAQNASPRALGGFLVRLFFDEDFLDLRSDGIRPDVIALGREMQEIVHVFLADGAIGLQVFAVNVHVGD